MTDLGTIRGQIALKDATATHKVNLCEVAAVALLLCAGNHSAAFTLTHSRFTLALFKVPYLTLADMQGVATAVMSVVLNMVNVILTTKAPVMPLVCHMAHHN